MARCILRELLDSKFSRSVRCTTVVLCCVWNPQVSHAAQQPANGCELPAEVRQALGRQQWTVAEQQLKLFVEARPGCAEPHFLFGYVLLRENQPDASLHAYSQAARLRPPTSEELTAVASDYILLKAYNDAQHWLQQAVSMTPVSPQAWYLLGRTQYQLDHNEDAVASFQHSLAILPDDPRSEYNLGLALERLQKPEAAREAYLTAIRWAEARHQPDAQPYLDLAVLERSRGNASAAFPLLGKAAGIAPGNPLIFQELGRTLIDLGRLPEAIAALQKAVALAPNAEPPHFFLGRAFRAAGKLPQANEQFAIVQQMVGTKSSNTTPNADQRP